MSRPVFKKVMRWDSRLKMLRLARVMWQRGTVGDGEGYSTKLSLALYPRLFQLRRESGREWLFTLLGLRLHFQRSFGGTYV